MAQRVQVLLVDDLDGGEATETISFAMDGVSYEIDLSDDNATRFRNVMADWTGHARRSGGRRTAGRRAAGGATSPKRQDLNDLREWGRQNGFKVSDRGRVSRELQAAYDEAHA